MTESDVSGVLHRWADAVTRGDLDGVCASHSDDIVMYDVPEPVQNRGIEAYRSTWPQFFAYLDGGTFTWQDLEIVAGEDIAFAFGIITCAPAGQPAFPVRLTIGLRRTSEGWMIRNEHHSVPST